MLTRAGVAVVLMVSTTGCVRHTIAPVDDGAGYAAKARATAEAATSSVETVLLLADVAADRKAFEPYVKVAVSEQEDTLDSIQSGFRSIQPPDAWSDGVRAELDVALSRALQHITAVRIAVRRDGLRDLDAIAAPLNCDAETLAALAETRP